MRKTIVATILILFVFACKDQPEKTDGTKDGNSLEHISETPEENTKEPHKTSTNTASENIRPEGSNPWSNAEGARYIRTDQQEDTECSCYCLELNFTGTTELCLVEDEMYINSRFKKNGDEIKIFFSGPSGRNRNEELPWDDFDENEPVAILTSGSNGNLELDWKGFTIDGELAVDYAIYGKKTLEGTYSKKQKE